MSKAKRQRKGSRTGKDRSPVRHAPPARVHEMIALAVRHHQQGRLADAEALYRQILAIDPNHADSLHLLGLIAHRKGNLSLALELIEQSLSLHAGNAAAENNLGNVHKDLGQLQTALQCFDRALALDPTLADACNNRGIVLNHLKDYRAALESLDRALLLKPTFADAYINRAATLGLLHRYAEALESSNQAVRLRPDSPEAQCNRGNSLLMLGQFVEALHCFEQAIRLDPGDARAYWHRGSALIHLNQYQLARESCEKSLSLNANSPEARIANGIALYRLRQYPSALDNLDFAASLDPTSKDIDGLRLYLKRSVCLWQDTGDQLEHLELRVARGERATEPFNFLVLSASPQLQRKIAEVNVHEKYSEPQNGTLSFPPPRHPRIRIGYYSAEFHNHATSYLIAGLFEQHDKRNFELVGFSMGPDAHDEMRQRTSSAMDRFVDIRSMSDSEVALMSREMEIDIAVDLKGFTADNRHGIFAHRPAPVQVSFLGYPGTTGSPWMDYLIADATVIPDEHHRFYSENIVTMPDSHQVNDPKREIAPASSVRAEEGLVESAFVYCCFNNNYKVTPEIFDIWMRILKRVDGSLLWLLEDNPWAADNLRREAERRDVPSDRLVFAVRRPVAEHLARHRLADLFLDTLPCNAHTTASDALWAGLPVLTCLGETFAGRVAASLLRAVQMPELVATSLQQYEELAVQCALVPGRSQSLKAQLATNRLSAPLFDIATYTRHLEWAFQAMVMRSRSNLPPGPIRVPKSRIPLT